MMGVEQPLYFDGEGRYGRTLYKEILLFCQNNMNDQLFSKSGFMPGGTQIWFG